MPLPLRLKFRLAIVIGTLFVPILFLFITMIPGVFMFETWIINLPTLHIDSSNGPGVIHISWGIWKSCNSNVINQTKCTATHWITNPYTFTIIEVNNRARVTVNQSWLNSLFLHFIAILYAISIGILHIVRYYHVITDCAVFKTIKNDMQRLSPGGFASVNTNPVSGFWLTLTAFLLTLVFLFLTWCYPLQGRSPEITSQEKKKSQKKRSRKQESQKQKFQKRAILPPGTSPGMRTPALASSVNLKAVTRCANLDFWEFRN
jgi:hypothetical protein